jgi:arabinan endo-1,5-alpha-L-arabinosidase
MYYWAPDVIHLGDRYLLYYAVSVFGKKTSAIALATNPTLGSQTTRNIRWTDQGVVVQTGDTNDYNAIDPAASLDARWKSLAFARFILDGDQTDPARYLTPANASAPDSPMYALAFNDSIEASYIYRHDGFVLSLCELGTMLPGHQQHL